MQQLTDITILGIESSCDDTSAAVLKNGCLLSNIIASQKVHEAYGGVVPELASRAHQQNIVPVVDQAIRQAGIERSEISAVAFTRGPGLLGSLLVGTSFAKGFALSLGIPIIEVNHLQGHVLAHFIREKDVEFRAPEFPHLCLLVSGGNSQIVLVKDYLEMEVIGQTIDDAAGEAFDKCAKVMGMPYPGGPLIDRLAKEGNPKAFQFAKPRIKDLDYSFSGLKTSFLYFLRDQLQKNGNFIEERKADLCASLQHTIIAILMDKLVKAAKNAGIRAITVAGGVSANSGLQHALRTEAQKRHWNLYIPKFAFTMDNAAMIAITGYYKYQRGEFAGMDAVPFARMNINE
jgi:N6-L-threonylcarbamoyladenine synthase